MALLSLPLGVIKSGGVFLLLLFNSFTDSKHHKMELQEILGGDFISQHKAMLSELEWEFLVEQFMTASTLVTGAKALFHLFLGQHRNSLTLTSASVQE